MTEPNLMVAVFLEEEGEPLLEPGPAEHSEDSPEAEAGHPALLRRIQQLYTSHKDRLCSSVKKDLSRPRVRSHDPSIRSHRGTKVV
jgi:hypothetical protein